MDDFVQTCPECGHVHQNTDGSCGVDGCTCTYEQEPADIV
jgi:hypothetical protein